MSRKCRFHFHGVAGTEPRGWDPFWLHCWAAVRACVSSELWLPQPETT